MDKIRNFSFFSFLCAHTVPNSVNGRFKIENTEFLEEYSNHNSPIYQTIVREIESGLMESLQDYNDVHVKVLNLS